MSLLILGQVSLGAVIHVGGVTGEVCLRLVVLAVRGVWENLNNTWSATGRSDQNGWLALWLVGWRPIGSDRLGSGRRRLGSDQLRLGSVRLRRGSASARTGFGSKSNPGRWFCDGSDH